MQTPSAYRAFISAFKKSARRLAGDDRQERLFDGDDKLFKEQLALASIYGEYGCGASTRWVISHTRLPVIAVDTSAMWIETVLTSIPENLGRITMKHIDLGSVGEWGRPKSYKFAHKFPSYTDYLWHHNEVPDLVLIDGRFRVGCFLATLKYAPAGTKILFDDYVPRQHYHYVEKFVRPSDFCGRQALFITPDRTRIDQYMLEADINAFRFCMD